MIETRESISAWAEETFGPLGSLERCIARALEEGAEALKKITSRAPPPEIAEELADTAIVLMRAAHRLNCISVTEWTDRAKVTPLEGAASAVEHMAKALHGDQPGSHIPVALLQLSRAAQAIGANLEAEIDSKMAINRARQWRRDGTGHGYHVKPGEAA